MNYSDIDEIPKDFTITNIKDGIKETFDAYKLLLAMNFEYFHSNIRWDPTKSESTLDLDLNSAALKLCYELVVGKILHNKCNYCDHCELAVGILEVYSVLLCKSKTFIKKYIIGLINHLDNTDSVLVQKFYMLLLVSGKVAPDLKVNIIARISYITNPQFYIEYYENFCMETCPDAEYIYLDKILLVVYPKKKWIGIVNPNVYQYCSYYNWGIAFHLPLIPLSPILAEKYQQIDIDGQITFNNIRISLINLGDNGGSTLRFEYNRTCAEICRKVTSIVVTYNSSILKTSSLRNRKYLNLGIENADGCSIVQICYKMAKPYKKID